MAVPDFSDNGTMSALLGKRCHHSRMYNTAVQHKQQWAYMSGWWVGVVGF